MRNRILKTALIMAALVVGLAATAAAQETISAEKRALIKEMIMVTDVEKTGDLMLKAMIAQFENEAPERIAESVNARTDLTPQERQKLRQEMAVEAARFTKRFSELVREKLNWPQLMEQLMYPVVNKYYTEDDLKNMIAFYKSPTGRKVIEVMPQMMTDVMARSNEIVKPQFDKIAQQILDEERKRLRK
jgi:uncharacterized protein